MHDLVDAQKLIPEGDTYSAYSLGILLGILAVALYLVIAIIAAANVAMASHLSLHPPRKEFIFEGRLLFCMMMQFATAVVSGGSLFLLCINIDVAFFPICVGASFISGFCILVYHVWMLFGLDCEKRMSKVMTLHIASLFLSTLACIFTLIQASVIVVWFTTLSYYLTIMCHSLFFSTRFTLNHLAGAKITILSLALCFLWFLVSALNAISGGWPFIKIVTMVASVFESILLIYMCREPFKERRRQRREWAWALHV